MNFAANEPEQIDIKTKGEQKIKSKRSFDLWNKNISEWLPNKARFKSFERKGK